MNQLTVKKIAVQDTDESLSGISAKLDSLQKHLLDNVPWPSFPYKPDVEFSIAHSEDLILLKYYVREKSIRAAAGKINGNVWEDACVEFFISFDDKGYYNLEFNCIGTALVGFGKNKSDRQHLPEKLIREIRYESGISDRYDHTVNWELILAIPASIFMHHSLSSFNAIQCNANFYKCGDNLPEPHFLSWNNIQSDHPNFHLPQFFGRLVFE